ncbi:MAG: galactokinase [Nocardioidaceae bacterium]|nr:galactokinase [Nocardioidaceae bacterium]
MVTWSAPGRVTLVGEHVDYNGGPVLPFAIDRRTEVTIRRRPDLRVIVTSQGVGTAEISSPLCPGSDSGWERYVAGALWAFSVGARRDVDGLDIDIASALPTGAGLSSSAAIECAVLCALNDLSGVDRTPRQIADLALRAEREYVGVPCGPMDQYAVMLAEVGHALCLDSGSLDTEQIPFHLDAAGLTLLVVNTRVRHTLGDGAYGDRRTACEQAAAMLGADSLRDVTVDRVLGLPDPVLRRRAHHVVTEIARVRKVVRLLRSGRPGEIGALLTASHRSLSDDFEVSCAELDTVVEAALAAGALGARMTGAGFGGSAIVLCRSAESAVVADRVFETFETSGFREPDVWPAGPAAGARRQTR